MTAPSPTPTATLRTLAHAVLRRLIGPEAHTFTTRYDQRDGQPFHRAYHLHNIRGLGALDCRLLGHDPHYVDLRAQYPTLPDRGPSGYLECRRCRRRPTAAQGQGRRHFTASPPRQHAEPDPAFLADPANFLLDQLALAEDVHWEPHTNALRAEVVRKPHGTSISLRLGSPGSETPIDVHLTVKGLGGVYASAEGYGTRLAHRLNPTGSRTLSLGLDTARHEWRLRWSLWADPDGGHYSRDPQRWRDSSLALDELVLGKRTHAREKLVTDARCTVPMPEGAYPGTAKLDRLTYSRSRWPFSRRRTVTYHAWIDLDGCILTGRHKYGDEDGICGTGRSFTPGELGRLDEYDGGARPPQWVGLTAAAVAHAALRDRVRERGDVTYTPATPEFAYPPRQPETATADSGAQCTPNPG